MRFTMRSRLSTSLPGLFMVISRLSDVLSRWGQRSGSRPTTNDLRRFSGRSFLDSLFVLLTLEDAIHIDAGSVNQIGFQLPNLNQALDLCDRYFGSSRHHRIEI